MTGSHKKQAVQIHDLDPFVRLLLYISCIFKLIELAAKLAVDYGWPLSIPEALAARNKGSSALAVALRTLQAITPFGTPLAQEAAIQAHLQAVE